MYDNVYAQLINESNYTPQNRNDFYSPFIWFQLFAVFMSNMNNLLS